MVLYKQSWGSERELVVGKAKKASWLAGENRSRRQDMEVEEGDN